MVSISLYKRSITVGAMRVKIIINNAFVKPIGTSVKNVLANITHMVMVTAMAVNKMVVSTLYGLHNLNNIAKPVYVKMSVAIDPIISVSAVPVA